MAFETDDESERIARAQALANAPDRLRPGDRFQLGYRVEHLLAKGGVSEVYVATREPHGTKVALKVPLAGTTLRPEANSGWSTHLLEEARRLANVGLPGFLRVIDVDVDPKHGPCVVTDLVDGHTLAAYVDAHDGPFSAPAAAQILRALARILGPLHKAKEAHGDLKPANIMVHAPYKRTQLLVLDMSTQTSWRSPLYLAPEGVQHRALNPRTDVFALGTMFYRLVAGRTPVTADPDNPSDVMRAQIHDAPDPLERVAPSVPAPLAALIHRMLAKDPAARPKDAREVEKEIDAVFGGALEENLREVFGVAPPTTRAAPPFSLVDDPTRWITHDGVDSGPCDELRARTRAAEGARRATPALVIKQGPRRLLGIVQPLAAGRSSIGRATDQDVVVPHASVGRTHGWVAWTEDGVEVGDDGHHAVYVDEVFTACGPLRDHGGVRGRLRVGDVVFELLDAEEMAPPMPDVPEDLFAEVEAILQAARPWLPLIEDVAVTSPHPSPPMTTRNAEIELKSRGLADTLRARLSSPSSSHRDPKEVAEVLAHEHALRVRTAIRAGAPPLEVIRRAYGAPIDWMGRAREVLATLARGGAR